MILPERGKAWSEIETHFERLEALDPDHLHGAMSCYSMEGSPEMQEVLKRSFLRFFHHNGVVRRMMPGVVKLEEELLSICAGILSGGVEGVVASITTGGSESIFCGVHGMREWGRDRLPPGRVAEVISPTSAHPALSKACHYLGLKLVRTPLGPDFRADVAAMEAAVTENTIGIVGSAPCWPYGLYDPIPALSELAVRKGLWLHVDACVGGYLAPFMADAGYPVPYEWDFRLPGVSSMSADLHKYGYAAKPASTIAFRSQALRSKHEFAASDWTGTPYVTPGFVGSRPIGSVASAYAILNFLGREGYVALARAAMRNKDRLLTGVEEIPGLRPWLSDAVLAYYTSDDPGVPVEKIVGGLRERGWASFGTPNPPLVQLAVPPFPEDGSLIDAYLHDLAEVVGRIRAGERVASGELKYAD